MKTQVPYLKIADFAEKKERIAEKAQQVKEAVDKIFNVGITPSDFFIKKFTDRNSFIDWVQKEAEKECGKYAPINTRKRVYDDFHGTYDCIAGDIELLSTVMRSKEYVVEPEIDIPYINEAKSIQKAQEDCTVYMDGEKLDLYVSAVRSIRNSVNALVELEKADGFKGSATNGSMLTCRNTAHKGFFYPTIKDIIDLQENDDVLLEFVQTVWGCKCIVDPKDLKDDGTKNKNG